MAAPVTEFQERYVRPLPGPALVIGSKVYPGREDRRKMFPDVTGLDMLPGEGVDIVHDLELPLDRKFAHIDCVSVLEHCRRPWVVAENICDSLVSRGTLFLSVPFVWRWHGYPDDFFRFTHQGIESLFPRVHWGRMQYGNRDLAEVDVKPLAKKVDGLPYFCRSELFAFGWLA